jgi:hypothetical protein
LHAAKLKGARVEEIDYRVSRGLDIAPTQRTSQLGDLEFMWAHIDDVCEAFEVRDEQAKMITAPNPGAHPGPR